MQMKLSEVRVRQQNLMQFASKKLPNKLGYAIAKNLIKLESEVSLIEKQRIAIIEGYAKKDEAGNPVIENNVYDIKGHEEDFQKEYSEFLETETEIDIYTVPCDVLDQLENDRYDVLSPAELVTLDFMIE